jgi:cytochrome o ubiquinol oxidase subunit II
MFAPQEKFPNNNNVEVTMNIRAKHSIVAAFFAGMMLLLGGCKLAILNPQGMIAAKETSLLIDATLVMLLVVVPAMLLTLIFAWRYRASNAKAKYSPNWSHSNLLEAIWWAIPCAIIVVLATLTWISAHTLDPYKPIDSNKKPLTIEAVSLDWKWLFIYPEQNIATVNFIQFPVDRPVKFLVTSDAPMNSLQITQLAGQIYAMAGMRTKLYLETKKPGDYHGLSTSFSGDGFSNMNFIARASSQADFNKWVQKVKLSPRHLTAATYKKLAKPSQADPVQYFSSADSKLFANIILKYMGPQMKKMGKKLSS